MTDSSQDKTGDVLIGTTSEVLHRAAAHYNADELAAATAICHEVIAHDPQNAEALHILGHIAKRTAALETAVGYFARSVTAAPTEARFNRSFAVALQQAGRNEQAVHAWKQFLQIEPDNVDGLLRLGRLLVQTERYEEAVATYSHARALEPNDRDLRFAMAIAQHRAGQLADAIKTYQALHNEDGNDTTVSNNLALVLIDTEAFDEAAEILSHAARLRPDDPEIQNNLGVCLARSGKLEAARRCFDVALSLRPKWSEGHLNLANLLRQEDRLEEAQDHYRAALDANPDDYRIYGSLALTLINANDADRAIATYRKAIELAPDDPELRKSLGIAQLLKGDFGEGWQNYEARLDCGDQRQLASARWIGEDIAGGSLLVYAEQGFGDTLQFSRYLRYVKDRAKADTVIFECQRSLHRLMQGIDGADMVISRGDTLPQADYHVALMSLPGIFDTTLKTIPASYPYLPTRQNRIAAPQPSDRKRIGLVWKGNPNRQDDDKRSCPLDEFAPILQVPGLEFSSLQPDVDPSERAWLARNGVTDLSEGLQDFTDTAAHIEALDLVVSIDTAVAHLAGALGKPVWVVLGASADWRYLIDRDDCPWYPSMRLFRQSQRGDWRGVAARIAAELRDTAKT